MNTWRWPKVPVLWTVYQAPYNSAGSRFMVVRTEKSLAYVSVNSEGELGRFARYARPLTYERKFDYERFESDFKVAMQRPYREKPRWQQLPLPLQWPPEPPNVIQLVFSFPEEIRFRLAA
jgi:hypothetical protein